MNCEENEIKGRVSISGSRIEALTDVLEVIIDENKYNREGVLLQEKRDDRQDIMLYLNYAVANIREVAGLKSGQSDNGLKNLSEDRLSKLADFLWTFRFDEPQFDFRKRLETERKGHEHDYRKLAPKLAMKIVELRNYFVHDNRDGNEALICDHDLYVLIEGLLRPMAEEAASGSRNCVDKLIKGHFLNLRDKDVERREDRKYDLTRKGIIFLTCLALYKDDAEEFLCCFKDMRIPNRRRDSLENLTEAAANAKFGGGKIPSKRAFHDAFTFFSYRRGRVSVGTEENIDYLHFAEIIGYLCKVPKASHDYLALEAERKLLADLAAASTESDENKLFKYDLSKQIRAREKFVSLAAAWCERFDKLPCLRFKRLDITPSVGRHRYMYGKEHDNAVRMDHHYIVEDGAIRFEWRPASHYKEDGIKIGCLRSSIGSQEFRRLLWCALRKAQDVNAALDNYFSAYHRILEIVLNSETSELHVFANSELAGLVQVVTGKTADELADDESALDRYFPGNLWRFFFQKDMKRDDEDLRNSLRGDGKDLRERIQEQEGGKKWERDPKLGAIGARIRKCEDFLLRFERFCKWRKDSAKKIKEKRGRLPKCKKGEILQPPRDCRITDASAVAMVIEYLQYHLPANNKLRQLQIGEQHNDGMRDHEYQMIRHAVAKFSYDNDSVLCGWNVVRRFDLRGRERPEWPGALRKLNNGNPLYRKTRRDDMIECYNNGLIKMLRPELQRPLEALKTRLGELAKKGEIQKFRGNFDLRDLAKVAAEALVEKMKAIPDDDISEATCRKFGVKRGLPLDHDSAIRTILGIDLEKWRRAFDYCTGRKFNDRRLESGEHIVSQVPLPNGFADRFVIGSSRSFSDVVEDGRVVWSRAFASLDDNKIKLQDFYETSPLVAYVRDQREKKTHANEFPDVRAQGKGINVWTSLEPQKWPPDFSRSGINKAIAQIKTAHNEDRMLLRFALDYWAAYQKSDSFDAENARIAAAMSEKEVPTVRTFFEAKRCVRLGKLKVWVSRNDVFSPDYPHIRENCSVLEELLKVEFPDRTEFKFDEVSQCFARQQRKCRLLRKEMVRLILEFEGRRGCAIPEAAYVGLKSEKVRKMEYETCYSRRYPVLSFEEYLLVANMRNCVMHDALLIVADVNYQRVKEIFARCGQAYEAPPPPSSRMVFKVS